MECFRHAALDADIEDVEREHPNIRRQGLRCATVAYSCLLAPQLGAKQYARQMQ